MGAACCVLDREHRKWSAHLLQNLKSMHDHLGAPTLSFLLLLISWLNGKPTHMHLYADSSGAMGILQRIGVGRLRHLSCRILWLQQVLACGAITIAAVSGYSNLADIGTKRWGCSRMRSLILGIYNMPALVLGGER